MEILFFKTEIYLPTLWGWGLILLGILVSLGIFLIRIHSFFSYHNPIKGQVLIVEGWLPDFVLQTAIEEFKQGKYRYILTTGGTLSFGSRLSEFKTYAAVAAASLVQMGMEKNQVIILPSPRISHGHTTSSALEVKQWILQNSGMEKMNLLSLGTHTRRSYYLLRRMLPEEIQLGAITVQPQDYNPDCWWKYSEGVKSVLYEIIAWFYIRIC